MYDLSGVKVGDKLLIKSYGSGRIEVAERITPTGRVITKTGTFTPNGRLMGDSSTWHRTYAKVATEDDVAGIFRIGLVDKFRRFDWNKLSAEDLKTINKIIVSQSIESSGNSK